MRRGENSKGYVELFLEKEQRRLDEERSAVKLAGQTLERLGAIEAKAREHEQEVIRRLEQTRREGQSAHRDERGRHDGLLCATSQCGSISLLKHSN